MMIAAIQIIIQPPYGYNVYCGPICTNTNNTQSTASSYERSALN